MRTNLYSLRSTREELTFIDQNKKKLAVKLDEHSSIRLLFKTEIDSNPKKILKDFAFDLDSDNPPEFYIYVNAIDTTDSSSLRRLFGRLIKAAEKEIAEGLFLSKGQKVDVLVHPVELKGQKYKGYCFTIFEKRFLVLPRMAFVKGDYISYICNAVNRAKEIFSKEFEEHGPGYLVSDLNTLPTAEEPDEEALKPQKDNTEKTNENIEELELFSDAKPLKEEEEIPETANTTETPEETEEPKLSENPQKFEALVLEEANTMKNSQDKIDSFEISVSDDEEEKKTSSADNSVIKLDPAEEAPVTEEENSQEDEAPEKKRGFKGFIMSFIPHKGDNFKAVLLKIIVLLAIIAFLVGGYMLINFYLIKPAVNNKDMEEIREVFYSEVTEQVVATNDEGEEVIITESSRNWDGVKEINDEIIGWITIKNTKIDYPVLWHKGDNADSQYYLYRNYKEKPSDFGSIFLDYRCENGTNCKNVILHGHNMGSDSSMFAQLTKYPGSTKFYRKAPVVNFDTPELEGEWIIFSVMKIDVTNTNDTIFNYFLTEFDSDARFMNFIYNIKARSYLDIDVPINENDRILTLSTCSYEKENMRTVAVARQIREGENIDEYINSVEEQYPQHTVYSTFSEEFKNGNTPWYDGKGDLKGDESLEYLPVSDMYKVEFLDAKGKVISTQYVIKGKDAEAPEEEPRKAASGGYYYVFKKWDKSFKNVTKDLTIEPVFTKHKLNIVVEETTWATDPNDYRDTSDEEEVVVTPEVVPDENVQDTPQTPETPQNPETPQE